MGAVCVHDCGSLPDYSHWQDWPAPLPGTAATRSQGRPASNGSNVVLMETMFTSAEAKRTRVLASITYEPDIFW